MLYAIACARCVWDSTCYAAGVISDTRLRNLRRLIAQYDRQRLFADAAEMNPSHLSQIVTGRRGLGENLARRIEETLGLPHLWLDQRDGVPPAPSLREQAGDYDLEDLRVARAIRSLPPKSRVALQTVLDAFAKSAPWDGEVERRKTR
jgi:transcriptional regulator with XRE-family HTH domain